MCFVSLNHSVRGVETACVLNNKKWRANFVVNIVYVKARVTLEFTQFNVDREMSDGKCQGKSRT